MGFELVATARSTLSGVLVVDEDDLSSQRMFGWHLASEAEASRYDADIAVQLSQRGVDKDTSRLRVSDGVIFRGNTTPGDDVAATSRSSGKCVAVYKRRKRPTSPLPSSKLVTLPLLSQL